MKSHILTEDGDARLLLLIDDGMLYVMDIDTQTGVRLPLETWQQVRAFVDGVDVAMTAVLDERASVPDEVREAIRECLVQLTIYHEGNPFLHEPETPEMKNVTTWLDSLPRKDGTP